MNGCFCDIISVVIAVRFYCDDGGFDSGFGKDVVVVVVVEILCMDSSVEEASIQIYSIWCGR